MATPQALTDYRAKKSPGGTLGTTSITPIPGTPLADAMKPLPSAGSPGGQLGTTQFFNANNQAYNTNKAAYDDAQARAAVKNPGVTTALGIRAYGDAANANTFAKGPQTSSVIDQQKAATDRLAQNGTATPPVGTTAAYVPRAAATVATETNPVITKGEITEKPSGTVSDDQRLEEIALKKYKGEEMSDDDVRFLFQQQQKQNKIDQEMFKPVTELLNSQTTAKEAKFASEEERLAAERKQKLEEFGGKQQAEFDITKSRLEEAGAKEREAAQTVLSFSGFGRSTVGAERQADIEKNVQMQITEYQRAQQLEKTLFEAKLNDADQATLDSLQAQVDEAKLRGEQFEIDSALKVAELNQQNKVNPIDAIDNITKVLSPSTHRKVNKDVSELLGYISDEFGNQIGEKPIPVSKENKVKYETYTDPYTQQVYAYNPFDPQGERFAMPGNGVETYTDPLGRVTSSSTSQVSGMADITTQVDPKLAEFAKNCVYFARQLVPNIPTGALSKQGRKDGLKAAEQAGYGSFDMSQVRPGDAIHTGEGDVGHTAYVVDRQGDVLTLLEANYQTGKITEGRKLNIKDPNVYGWIRPQPGVRPSIADAYEGNNYSINDQISGNISFTPDQVSEFEGFADGKGLPSFKGRSQQQKDAAEADWRKNYNYWSRTQGQQRLSDRDFTQVNQLATRYKDLTKEIRTLQQGNAILNNFNVNHTNPYDDQALIFSFMKVLDPGSVVREGEFNTARRNSSVLDSFAAGWDKAINGTGMLTAGQRKNIISTMRNLYNEKRAIYDNDLQGAAKVGQIFNLDPSLYLDFLPDDFNKSQYISPAQSTIAPKEKNGVENFLDSIF